jgi:diacylglycerol O-acyltransferase / wax synthase
LTICGGALRRFLRDTHDLPKDSLRAFVPVSVREAGNTEMNNQVIGMICSLATDIADPLKRLHAVHESALRSKQFTDTVKAALLGVSLPIGAPVVIQGMMNMLGHYHWADRLRPLVNLTVSNNIGSPQLLYLAGAKLVATFPMSIPTHGSALNITVQSYCDNMHIGLTACRHTLPDVRKLGDYIVTAHTELKNATVRHTAKLHSDMDIDHIAARRIKKMRATSSKTTSPRAKRRFPAPLKARVSSNQPEIPL